MKISIYTAVLIFLVITNGFAQEPTWLTKLRKIEPLKSTEKDVEKVFGKPIERYSHIGEYESEVGKISVYYSEGKCSVNENSQYDVDRGVVDEINLFVTKEVKFKALNLNLVNFEKQYVSDVPGLFSYRNEELGIGYHIDRDLLTYISVSASKSYAYLECPQKPKPLDPVTDDVDQETFIKLTQLKPLQNTQSDVAAIFGEPLDSENQQLDFYMYPKYAFGFRYSTGNCTFIKDDKWNVVKGQITEIIVVLRSKGITSSLDLTKLEKTEEKSGFTFYKDRQNGIEYKLKDDRIWQIRYFPAIKNDKLKCVK
jgi:hypothetical protein